MALTEHDKEQCTPRGGMGGWMRRASVVALMCGLASCYIGYDSRWGEGKRSQEVVAAHATPNEIVGTEGESAKMQVIERPIRAYVSGSYAGQVTDWKRQISDLVERANDVLRPTLRLQLDL